MRARGIHLKRRRDMNHY